MRLPSYQRGMRLMYIASREDAEDEVNPSRRELNDKIQPMTPGNEFFNSATHTPFDASSSPEVKRIIRSLEEIEDEENMSDSIKGSAEQETIGERGEVFFSGDYYERHSEIMNFRMEGSSDVGDWEGSVRDESGDKQDDDVTDDVINVRTHEVAAVKRTEMATAVDPRGIELYESKFDDGIERGLGRHLTGDRRTPELSAEESDSAKERPMEFSSASGSNSAVGMISDDEQDLSSGSGYGHFNKTIMREVQHNLHKVWRYASSGQNLDMVAKGPKDKEEEQKLQQIYNLLIKHETAGAGRSVPDEAVSGEGSGFVEEPSGFSGESGDESGKKEQMGSAEAGVENYDRESGEEEESRRNKSARVEDDSRSAGKSNSKGNALDYVSDSGSGLVAKKLEESESGESKKKVVNVATLSGENSGDNDRLEVSGEKSSTFHESVDTKVEKVDMGNLSGESSGNDDHVEVSEGSPSSSGVYKDKRLGSEREERIKEDRNGHYGESSGKSDGVNVSNASATLNTKLMKEVEHNLHNVWRYAAPKKDLDMVAKGPKGKEEEQKVTKIYNIVSKHETGSAFIDFDLRKDKQSDDKHKQTQKHKNGGHKSRKSKVKFLKLPQHSTGTKLHKLHKGRKHKKSKSVNRLKPLGKKMDGHYSANKAGKTFVKKISEKSKARDKNSATRLALLGKEMKELAPEDGNNEGKKENGTVKSEKDKGDTNSESKATEQQNESDVEAKNTENKKEDENIVLDKQEPFDKTRLEIGKTLEELILGRIAQLEASRQKKKPSNNHGHWKDSNKGAVDKAKPAPVDEDLFRGETHPKEDKLLSALEKIKFLNGPSTVYNRSRFVYLKQCGLYVEEYNVSKTRASWNNDLFSPYSYLYEMPKNYHSCNSSLWMNRTDLRGDVFLSFRVMSIKGNTMINNANICEKYCCQEPRCQSWTVRLQQADTANCAKGTYCCWLKSAVPSPIHDSDECTSGVIHRQSTRHPPPGMRSAVPLGGLGTGSFELRADGTIHEWTIENQSPGGSAKLNKGALNMAVFGVRVADEDKSKAALLRIHAPHGYPGVESLSYSGSYPVSRLTPGGSITEHVEMNLYAFPSFHMREPRKSAVPAVAFTLSLRSKSDKPLDVSFLFNLPLGQQDDTIRVGENFGEVVFTRMIKPADCAHACSKMPKCMAWTTNGPTSCLLKDKMPLHAWATGIVSGLKGEWNVDNSMLTCHRPGFFPQSGSTTLYALDDDEATGSFAVADDFADIWKNFSKTGEIGVSNSPNKTGIHGSASVKTTLLPGEKKSLTIILSWYYPHRDLAKVHVGNMYAVLFNSSQDVAKHMRNDLLPSVEDIQSWHRPIAGNQPVKRKPINKMVKDIPGASKEGKVNELPNWLKDLLINSISFWRSGFWTEDGRWRQWEALDCNDIDTIQNDIQRIIPYTLFFPDLVRDLLISWADNQYSSGMLQEALTSGCLGPTGKLDYAGGRVMADTTTMFVVGLYHYYQWTGDRATLDKLWPAAKRAMAWVIVDSTKGTGLPFRKVSSYDIVALDKYDHDAYNTFIYLLSLRSAQELGKITNDTKFVSTLKQAFERAQKRVDLELWDSTKQFYHAWWDMEYGSPDWIMSDSLYGQVWAYSLGLGDLVPRDKLKAHLLNEIEQNDSPFGLKVLHTGKPEITQEDTSIVLSRHTPGCKSLENITKHNSIWMGADADWASLMLHLDADPIMALNRAKKSLDHWRSTLNDQWNIHGLIASNGYGLDGLPWATSHYSFHLVLWHIPLALSGQQYTARNASLTFWPKYSFPFNLPFFTPKAWGTIQGAYEKASGREEDFDDEEEEEMFTFTVDSGELTLKELAVLGSTYGGGEISLKEGQSVTWSRPKQDVKNILQQL
ncbi:uncharacterized protein [Montipora foliosa]